MLDNLNLAAKQFAELSEANIKAATAGMFKSPKKSKPLSLDNSSPAPFALPPPRRAGRPHSAQAEMGGSYCMCWPPLMAILAPVTKAASSEHR